MNELPEEFEKITFTRYTPMQLLGIVAVCIFFVEFGIMIVLQILVPPLRLLESLIDAATLVGIVFPALYYLIFKPLSLQKELFSALAQSSPDCIKLFNREGSLLFMNAGGLEEFGYSDLEEAKKHAFTDSLVPASQALFREAFAGALRGEPASIELQHTKESSNRVFCLESIRSVRGTGETISGIISVSRDITPLKKIDKELREKVDDLEVVNKLMVGRELKMIELKNEVQELRLKETHRA